MDAATLVRAEPGLGMSDALALIDEVNQAMDLGKINTINRAAGFLGVYIGEESVSMRYREEIPNAVMWRYAPYIGRTFGQLTWVYNYRGFGHWMHSVRPDLLADPEYFVKNPATLAGRQWAVWGALWYWITHGLNTYADRGDVMAMTRIINGGTNGYSDRLYRWNLIRGIGAAILPEDDMITQDQFNTMLKAASARAIIGDTVEPEIAQAITVTLTGGRKEWPRWTFVRHPLMIGASRRLRAVIAKVEGKK